MSIINCKHCKYPVADDADSCPHCGSKSPKPDEAKKNKSLVVLNKLWGELFFWGAVFLFCYLFSTEIFHKIFR